MKLHLMKEEEKTKWIREHQIFCSISTIFASIALILLSIGLKNGFIYFGADEFSIELSILISYLCMFLAGMYFAGFYISLFRWKRGEQESEKKHNEKGVSEG